MRIESDKKVTRYMDSLAEFENYLKVTHVSEMNLIQDLMSDLKDRPPPTSVEESIPCIQEALLVLETIKKKKLGPKFTDRDLEDILKHSLTRKDRDEYRRSLQGPDWGYILPWLCVTPVEPRHPVSLHTVTVWLHLQGAVQGSVQRLCDFRIHPSWLGDQLGTG